ncbi:MAG: hypothetical protein ACFB15_21930 [Cyclobacteriaceae bacterium]
MSIPLSLIPIIYLIVLSTSLVGWGQSGTSPCGEKIRCDYSENLSSVQRQELIAKVEEQEDEYDSEVKLLSRYVPPTANHYHSKLIDQVVHPLRQSAWYAADLLDTEVSKYQQRAIDVLQTILAHQDVNPENDTYGIWPYNWEEPLEAMAKPDWNWADFIGAQLLEIYVKHRKVLPDELQQNIQQSLLHASRSIKKRDVKPGYTNIAIMGTFVTYLTGYLFDNTELQDYAEMRLKRFYDYTVDLGGFQEYNSPTYTRVALDELARMNKYIIDPEAREMIDYCYRTGWETIASHFHPSTRQLAGPHSRSYSTLMRDQFYDLLYQASDGKLAFVEELSTLNHFNHQVPPDLMPYFTELPEARVEVDTFSRDEHPVIGYTYLHPDFALSSVNCSSMWQQRRPLLAYWGTSADTRYMQFKLLHDFVEFSAGHLFSVQEENTVLSALTFATDGGDYHISLDRLKNGQFEAEDLRQRFELGHTDLHNQVELSEDGFILTDDHVQLQVAMEYAQFGKLPIQIKKGHDEERSWVDWIIYAGDTKQFKLANMKQAAFGWTLTMVPKEEMLPLLDVSAEIEEEALNLKQSSLQLGVPLRPNTEQSLLQSVIR